MKNLIIIPMLGILALLGFWAGERSASARLECSQLCGCQANLGCSCVANNAADCECQNCTCKTALKRCCKEAK